MGAPLAQLLERRADPIPEIYLQILPSLLQQSLWASKANQPALTRLIKAYIKRSAPTIVGNQQLFHQILGLIQFLTAFFIIGWIASIYWGFLILKKAFSEPKKQMIMNKMPDYARIGGQGGQ